MNNTYIYILVMFAVSFAIRVLPLTLIRGEIKNRFFRSFLHYVPYVTLAVMTFPAIVEATQVPLAWLGAGLFPVSVVCCVVVFAAELLLL